MAKKKDKSTQNDQQNITQKSKDHETRTHVRRKGRQFLFHMWHTSSIYQIREITKLPNSEQSYKGKVKTHKYINRQNQSTTGKL